MLVTFCRLLAGGTSTSVLLTLGWYCLYYDEIYKTCSYIRLVMLRQERLLLKRDVSLCNVYCTSYLNTDSGLSCHCTYIINLRSLFCDVVS